GNTGTATQNVTIQDTTAPALSLLGNTPVTVEGGAAYSDAGATASDIVDGDLTASIVVGGLPINTSVLGTHTVTYNVTDSSGNAAVQVTRTVNVVDTTPPVITMPPDVTVDQTGDLTPVTLGAATVTDNIAVASVTHNVPAEGYPVGITIVTGTATDTSGNVSSATVQVTVNPVPLVQLQILKDFLNSLALNSGLYKKLNKNLSEAETAIISGNNAGAIKALNSFINTVQSNTPQSIAQADADEMIQRAQAIIALL
ncbi:MAG: DUF5011 domain-containing protein, partial [Nitrospinota bacterium]|nr:DUF5011 domain-containing protein [Nitrospinota bacterium]